MIRTLRNGLRGSMRTFFTLNATLLLGFAEAQYLSGAMEYAVAKEYTIGGITVSGCLTRDTKAVELFSGLQVGDKITVPGERIGRAIQAIWDQHLFTDLHDAVAHARLHAQRTPHSPAAPTEDRAA